METNLAMGNAVGSILKPCYMLMLFCFVFLFCVVVFFLLWGKGGWKCLSKYVHATTEMCTINLSVEHLNSELYRQFNYLCPIFRPSYFVASAITLQFGLSLFIFKEICANLFILNIAVTISQLRPFPQKVN